MSVDSDILQSYGGIANNSLNNVLKLDNNDDTDGENQVCVINHSPYYDNDLLIPHLQSKKESFCILSTNIESIHSKFSDLEILLTF